MTGRLAGKVALVTGGASGIGRGIAQRFAREGAAVVVADVDAAGARAACEAIAETGGTALAVVADVSREADCRRMVAEAVGRFERLEILVSNAGIAESAPLAELEEAAWERLLAVNLKGPYFLSQCVAREMVRLLPHLVHPTLVNISSISSYTVSTNRGDYCVSKAGLGMVTQLFAVRLAGHGIRVYEVRPGIIETDMTSGVREKYDPLIAAGLTPIRRWGTPEDVGRAAWELAEIRLGYETFIGDFAALRPASPAACFRMQTLLVHAWRKFPFLDPDLPAELLSARWPRRRAHELFVGRHARWAAPARGHFEELELGRPPRAIRAA